MNGESLWSRVEESMDEELDEIEHKIRWVSSVPRYSNRTMPMALGHKCSECAVFKEKNRSGKRWLCSVTFNMVDKGHVACGYGKAAE